MSCRCDAGYTGPHCDKKDYSVLYVVPGPVRFQYVLIAAVIGTVQIAVICVVVLCITRSVLRLRGDALSLPVAIRSMMPSPLLDSAAMSPSQWRLNSHMEGHWFPAGVAPIISLIFAF